MPLLMFHNKTLDHNLTFVNIVDGFQQSYTDETITKESVMGHSTRDALCWGSAQWSALLYLMLGR